MTLEEAREKVQAVLEDEGWVTAPYGWEDAEMFQVVAGPAQWVEDGDDLYAPEDGPVFLVEKRSGEVQVTSFLVEEERLMGMTPVGEGHPPE